MKIVIIGAGFTGIQLAKLLIKEKNEVILIDNDEEIIRHASNILDCTIIHSDGNNLNTLEEAGISKADALVCVTDNDEVNMITCSLVDAVYPNLLKIARVRNYAYYYNKASVKKINEEKEKERPLYGIDYMIHPDVEAADAIVQAVDTGVIGNVLSFEGSDFKIARIKVEKGSSFDGLVLKDIKKITSAKLVVSYIEKDGKTTLPQGNTLIECDNVIGVLAAKNNFSELLKLCGASHIELKKIALVGAGRIGSIVALKLLGEEKRSKFSKLIPRFSLRNNHDFVIIDKDEKLAQEASDNFPLARVLCADATDESFLKEEDIPNFDLVICATHNHELNMVLAAYLESLGVKQTISLVASSDFSPIATKLGIDVPIPLRDTVVDSIMSHLRGNSVKEIHTVTSGTLEIDECVVTKDSRVLGCKLKDIDNTSTFLVLMTKESNKDEYKIANGDTELKLGDNVVLITSREYSKRNLEYISGNK